MSEEPDSRSPGGFNLAGFVNPRRALALAIVGVAIAGALILVNGSSRTDSDSTTGSVAEAQLVRQAESSEAKQGAMAPDFEATTLSGQRVRLSDYRGKAVVPNFWGTTCASCLAEIPDLDRVWKEHSAEGLVVLGVNVGDNKERAQKFFQEMLGASYPSVLDQAQTLARAYRAPGLPMTVFISPEGRIERIIAGEINYKIFDRFRMRRVFAGEKEQ